MFGLTGLRRNELRTLTWGDLELEAEGEGTFTVRAAVSKDRIEATLPLREDLRIDLRALRARKRVVNPGGRVFGVRKRLIDTLRDDMHVAKIEEKTKAGVLDVHSLRKSTNTWLRQAGTPDAIVKRLMRHSDGGMTGLYTDESQLDVRSAIENLPQVQIEIDVGRARADERHW